MSNDDGGKWSVILILGLVFSITILILGCHWADQYGKCHKIQCAPCECQCGN